MRCVFFDSLEGVGEGEGFVGEQEQGAGEEEGDKEDKAASP